MRNGNLQDKTGTCSGGCVFFANVHGLKSVNVGIIPRIIPSSMNYYYYYYYYHYYSYFYYYNNY